jgi:hypothetical protein
MTRCLTSITELAANAPTVHVLGYSLAQWSDGTYFIEAPSGEGTSVSPVELAGLLKYLFERSF